MSTKELAQKVGLSVTPTYERIKRLEKEGYIRQYVAILDRKLIDKKNKKVGIFDLGNHILIIGMILITIFISLNVG